MLRLLVAILLAAFSAQTFAKVKYSSVAEMVAEQKVIRVLLDHAPGFGNQSATVNLMNRLRQMNFNGTFEFVYSHDEEEKAKVINLFNLPIDLPAEYTYEDSDKRKIIFIDEKLYIEKLIHHLIEPVKLGVTGAHDSDTEHECEDTQGCMSFSDKFADFMNADVFIRLQPWFNQERHEDSIFTRGGNEPQQVSPRGKYLLFPSATLEQAKTYLEQDPAGMQYAKKMPALNVLIDGIQQSKFNLLPVYGYSFRKSFNYQNQHEYLFPFNILQVITAARYAQQHGVRIASRPIVIPVFYDYREEMDELNKLLQSDNWAKYEPYGAPQAREALRDLGLKNKNVLLMAALADADTVKILQNLQPGQILLLSMGPMPKILFDGIYTYQASNILPQVREGESSLSALLQAGKPHFRCVTFWNQQYTSTKWEPEFALLQDQILKQRLTKFYGKYGFCGKDVWQVDPLIYKTVGDFMIEATDPDSAISRYFKAIKLDTQKQENDRIYRGLEEALRVMP